MAIAMESPQWCFSFHFKHKLHSFGCMSQKPLTATYTVLGLHLSFIEPVTHCWDDCPVFNSLFRYVVMWSSGTWGGRKCLAMRTVCICIMIVKPGWEEKMTLKFFFLLRSTLVQWLMLMSSGVCNIYLVKSAETNSTRLGSIGI